MKAQYRMSNWRCCPRRAKLTMAGVEIELRKPSMLHGKKGFERLVYAAKNVLNQSLTWLFCDLDSANIQSGSSSLNQHHPTIVQGDPLHSVLKHVLSPPFSQAFSDSINSTISGAFDAEARYELIEWLGLVVLESPRVLRSDSIDPHLSRYSAPEGSAEIQSLRIIKWQGMIGARWLTRMLNTCMLVSPDLFSSRAIPPFSRQKRTPVSYTSVYTDPYLS